MNIIDILLIVVVLLSAWSGFRKGFLFGFLDLIGWVGSIVVALVLYKDVTVFIEENITTLGVWTMPVVFILLMIISRSIFSMIARAILRPVRPETHDHPVNRAFGVGPGIVNGLVNATIIAALLLALPLSDWLTNKTRDSRIAGRLAEQVEWLDDKLSPVFDEAINKTINRMNTVDPESKKSVNLPFTVANPRVREDLEARMLELVNEERAKEGLQPLQADPELAVVARAHSKDMFARGYFAHVTPEGKTPSDRIREGGVKFLTAGENLALGQTLKICHEGLMNSPGHRANILHKAYGRVGIGILDGGIYGLMVTQNFRN
ncbi:MAG TPA: CvpA family protein [Chitinophagaceae bacterium]|nr:CvpA family protein [Chitinophagaceae bacterium]